MNFDLTTREAWYMAKKPDHDEYRIVPVAPREHAGFPEQMRSMEGQRVEFRSNGDPIISAEILSVWAPYDFRRPELYVNDWQLEFRGDTWRRLPPDNTGYWQHRIADGVPDEYALIERALAETWKEHNDEERNVGTNHGCGLLQDIMLSTAQHEKPANFEPWVTNRERKIVATVIQWLGTNCGRSFLFEASKKMGRPMYPFQEPPTK